MSITNGNFLHLNCGEFDNAAQTYMQEVKQELQIVCDGKDAVWSSLGGILFLTLFDPAAIKRAEALYGE